MPSGGTARPSVAHLDTDAIESQGFDFCSWYALLGRRSEAI